jgi:PAS domain-containing protein
MKRRRTGVDGSEGGDAGDGGGAADSAPSGAAGPGGGRKWKPCFMCLTARGPNILPCDCQRPCQRCLQLGVPKMCMGPEIGSVATGRGSYGPAAARIAPGKAREAFSSTLPDSRRTPVVPSTKNSSSSSADGELADGTSPSDDFPSVTVEELSPEATQDGEGGEHSALNQQMMINGTLVQEIQRLRQQQQEMAEEMLSLKMQNLGLNSKMDQWSQVIRNLMAGGAPPSSQIGSADDRGAQPHQVVVGSPAMRDARLASSLAQQPMVVFDLTTQPAVVMTCNDTFARLLGYNVAGDVRGMPWVNFIHPDQLQRTLSILSERTPENNTVRFPQLYVEKEGGLFFTVDTHNIFFDNGRPVSDLVFVTLSTREDQASLAQMMGTTVGPSVDTQAGSASASESARAPESSTPISVGPSHVTETTHGFQLRDSADNMGVSPRSQQFGQFFSPGTVSHQQRHLEMAQRQANLQQGSQDFGPAEPVSYGPGEPGLENIWSSLDPLDDADLDIGLDSPFSAQDVHDLLSDTTPAMASDLGPGGDTGAVLTTPDGDLAWGDVASAPFDTGGLNISGGLSLNTSGGLGLNTSTGLLGLGLTPDSERH